MKPVILDLTVSPAAVKTADNWHLINTLYDVTLDQLGNLLRGTLPAQLPSLTEYMNMTENLVMLRELLEGTDNPTEETREDVIEMMRYQVLDAYLQPNRPTEHECAVLFAVLTQHGAEMGKAEAVIHACVMALAGADLLDWIDTYAKRVEENSPAVVACVHLQTYQLTEDPARLPLLRERVEGEQALVLTTVPNAPASQKLEEVPDGSVDFVLIWSASHDPYDLARARWYASQQSTPLARMKHFITLFCHTHHPDDLLQALALIRDPSIHYTTWLNKAGRLLYLAIQYKPTAGKKNNVFLWSKDTLILFAATLKDCDPQATTELLQQVAVQKHKADSAKRS